jgi:hypothetical protein
MRSGINSSKQYLHFSARDRFIFNGYGDFNRHSRQKQFLFSLKKPRSVTGVIFSKS